MKKITLFIAIISIFFVNAQIVVFNQNFESSNEVTDFIDNSNASENTFEGISTTHRNYSVTATNNNLRFNRTGTGSMYAYRNFDFATNPRFVEFKFDFEASNHELNKNNVFSIFIGSNFSASASATSSDFASRIGISTKGAQGNFNISAIDNIGGSPSTGTFSGKQTIRFIVNSTNQEQTYIGPGGNSQLVGANKMDVWVGTTLGINDFSLKNPDTPKGDISGFKLQATSTTGNGVFDFDNIVMTDLLGESNLLPLFAQNFDASNDVTSYINSGPDIGQFNEMTTGGGNIVTSINNNALRFNRTGRGTIYAYRNFDFSTNPTFVELKFDFEVSNNELNKSNVFSVFVGSEFSSALSATSSNFASRFGISTVANAGSFKLSPIDNIGGSPSTLAYSGKQTIRFYVNSSAQNQNYLAPDGSTQSVAAGKMDLWIGTSIGINDFSLKNTLSPKGDITGFKIQATSSTGTGIFDFDNIAMTDLLGEAEFVSKTKSLVHPHIWASPSDRQRILDNIDQYSWASNMFDQLIDRNLNHANNHINNPSSVISTIPDIPGPRDTHRNILNIGVESALLYYLTEEDKYGQIAADILHEYVNMISLQNPLTFQFYTSSNFNHLIPPRELFPRVAVMYDFVQPFISKPETKVYDESSNTQVSFNFDTSQLAFEAMANNVLKVGGTGSNHSVLELPGALYSVMCMEDDLVRASFFDRLWNGDSRQDGIQWMLNRFTSTERLWPESVGYAKFTQGIFIQLMNIIDNYKPELELVSQHRDIVESIFVYENILYPNGATMAYGDIGRSFANHIHFFRSVMAIADRKGYADLKARASTTLQKIYKENGGYNPVIKDQALEWSNPLQLLWSIDIDASVSDLGEPKTTTQKISHSGVVMQRNYSGVDDEQNGLMYYTHGGSYVHAHAGGIDMELYGAGYVIGPDFGTGTYGTALHNQYAGAYAAHNTIIVNGASVRGISNNGSWENITDEVVLVAHEPKTNASPIAQNFSFSTQFLDDDINNVDQQRTNGIVRTSPTSGYYIDVFRSTSNSANNFHDYLFHGLGDTMQFTNNSGAVLPLQDTPNRYQNDVGDGLQQPGWRWFSGAKTSSLTDAGVSARFDIEFDNKYLHVNMPGGVNKEYTSALSPPTKEVRNGYDKKDTQVLMMRKYGEAWNEPFIAVYEPSGNAESTVKSTSYIYSGNKIVGVKVYSVVNGEDIVDYVLSNDSNNQTVNIPEITASFIGRYGVIRIKNSTDISLYIGEGQEMTFENEYLTADAEGKAYATFESSIVLSSLDVNKPINALKAYPNPTAGVLHVDLPYNVSKEAVLVDVYNLHGQLVKSSKQKVFSGKTKIDLSLLPTGAYFVKLKLDTPTYIKVFKN